MHTAVAHVNKDVRPAIESELDPSNSRWDAASDDQRTKLLDDVGRARLCRLLSAELMTELVEAIIGLEIDKSSTLRN